MCVCVCVCFGMITQNNDDKRKNNKETHRFHIIFLNKLQLFVIGMITHDDDNERTDTKETSPQKP